MLFFLFRKSYIFWFFLFSKKFIISHEKVEKQTTQIMKIKRFQQKAKKINTTFVLIISQSPPLQNLQLNSYKQPNMSKIHEKLFNFFSKILRR